ncbi:MAG: hypothetical protein QXL96_10555 [Ignisphaera sp.]
MVKTQTAFKLLAKTRVDDKKCRQDRLTEAKYRAELAKRFLEDGSYRNARCEDIVLTSFPP